MKDKELEKSNREVLIYLRRNRKVVEAEESDSNVPIEIRALGAVSDTLYV